MATSSRSAGDVSVRFSVQDAETVRLALEALGKDGQAALNRINAAGQPTSAGLNALSSVMAGVRGQATSMAYGLGLVGEGLLVLGPAGLVAAAAAGGVYLLFSSIKEGAKEFGTFSRQVRDNAEAVNLSNSQYQAATLILQQHGVQEEKAGTILAKIAKSREEAAHATGALYDALKQVSPELARQFALSTSMAQALDLLSKALAGATEKQRVFLMNAAGGRGSALAVAGLLDIGSRGGIGAATDDLVKLGRIFQSEVVDKQADAATAAEQKAQFVERAWNSAYAAIYAKWKDFKNVIGLGPEGEVKLATSIARMFGGVAGGTSDATGAPDLAATIEATQKKLEGLEDERKKIASEWRKPWLTDTWLADLDIRIGNAKRDLAALQNQLAAGPQPMGPSGALSQFGPPQPTQKDILQADIPEQQKRLALLGETASATERVKAETDKLTLALLTRAGVTQDHPEGLTDAQVERIKANYEVIESAKRLAARTSLGIATQSEIVEQHLAELREKYAKAEIVSVEQRATAEKIVRREALETANALAVRASSTPALTKLSQDSSNLAKTMDENLAGALRGIGQEFSLLNNSTDTFAKRLQNVALRIADAAYQAVLMKVAIQPLANLISGGLGSLLGATATAGNIGGTAGLLTPIHHMGGIVGGPSPMRLVPPHIFAGARRMHGGGPVLGPGEMPIIAEIGERIIPKGMRGGSQPVQVVVEHTVINNHPNANISQRSESDGRGGRKTVTIVDEMTAGAIASGPKTAASMRAQFGASNKTVRR